MNISTFVIFMLILSGVFFTYAEIVRESNENIDGTYLNSSEWSESYDYIDDINKTYSPIGEKIKAIQDEDTGWWGKLTEGITAIPYAILLVPQSVFGSLVFAGNILIGSFTALQLPIKIIALGTTILLVWGIFKLIEFYNKTTF